MTTPFIESAAAGSAGPDGRVIVRFTLRNANGLELRFLNYGGVIQSLLTPDRAGRLADITLGFDNIDAYTRQGPYFGSLIGRYANRIAGATFRLHDRTYTLAANNGPNHLHGGQRGFDKVFWQTEPFQRGNAVGAVLSYTSPDGEENYPGTLHVRVTMTFTDSNALILDYYARTDADTPVNLTQHSYFNLAGHDAGDILEHELTINASRFTPVNGLLIPTGELRSVTGTPFDFRSPALVGAHIGDDDEQLHIGAGYDHNYVLDGAAQELKLAARLLERRSGRWLEVHTTEPGLQFHSGNYLAGVLGKGGCVYPKFAGLALETQHFPDSPNQPDFPTTILKPGQPFVSRTEYRFGVVEQ